jgi:hypothetical protein
LDIAKVLDSFHKAKPVVPHSDAGSLVVRAGGGGASVVESFSVRQPPINTSSTLTMLRLGTAAEFSILTNSSGVLRKLGNS